MKDMIERFYAHASFFRKFENIEPRRMKSRNTRCKSDGVSCIPWSLGWDNIDGGILQRE
jgi:hypothetical protein